MAFQKKEFTIKESKDLNLARFFITYKSDQPKSYQLLSSLKQQHDLILEIDSTLINLPTNHETDTAALSVLKGIKEMGIDYRYQQSEAKSNKSLLGIINLNKNYTAHRILAYIPDKVWQDNQFQMLIPRYGARYYICKEQVDAKKLLEDLHCGRITEDEKTVLFNFIIYDCMDFGQMGIKTTLSKEELQKQLTV